jgi:hypothetical protein
LLEHDGWQLAARWPPPAWRAQRAVRYGALYRRATASAGARCLVFWPAGRFIEFHGPQRLVAEAVLGLRRVRLARGDYALTAGFPARLAPRFAVRAPQAQCSVVAVGQRRPWRSATAPTRVPIAVLLTRSSLSWVCGVDR